MSNKRLMKYLFIAAAMIIAAPASAQNFFIPAKQFDEYAEKRGQGGFELDAEGKDVRVLGVGGQLNIQSTTNPKLYDYMGNLRKNGTAFKVCARVANLNNSNNLIRIHHPNRDFTKEYRLASTQYRTLCSMTGEPGDATDSAGLKLVSEANRPNGPVEIRNVVIKPESASEPTPEGAGQLTTKTAPSWGLVLERSPERTVIPGDEDKPEDEQKRKYEINEQARDVLVIGDVVYVGGDFKRIVRPNSSESRAVKYLAAFDRNTGLPIKGFDLKLNGRVKTLAASPDDKTLYIGGNFTKVGEENRRFFAAIDISSGSARLAGFRLQAGKKLIAPNRSIEEIAIDNTNNRLYIGGSFTKFGDVGDHAYAAAFDISSGQIVKRFKPKPNKRVTALIPGGREGLWIGGEFKKIRDVEAIGLALVEHDTGELKKSSPKVKYPVIDLAATSSQLFVAGGGTNNVGEKNENGGEFAGNIASAYDRRTKKMQWELQGDGNVQGVDVGAGQYVYFGGHYRGFQYIRDNPNDDNGFKVRRGVDVERLSRHDKRTGKIDFTWLPFVDGIKSVNAIDVTVDGLFVVGDFSEVGGDTTNPKDPRRKKHSGFAMFNGATK